MVTALAELDTNEDFWPHIVSRLSEGEFFTVIVQEYKINHSLFRNWIRGNKKREQEFNEAEALGKRHRISNILRKTYETATADIDEKTTRMEQLRAAEILLKQDSGETRPPSSIANIAITFVQAQDGKPQEKVIDSVP